MAMTITSARLVKNDAVVTPDGTEFDVEWFVEFTGAYSAIEAKNVVSVTDGTGTYDLTVGAAMGDGTEGIVVTSRAVEFGQVAMGSDPGDFTIKLKYAASNGQFTENPLLRKDVLTVSRNPQAVPVARDLDKKIIATYRVEGDASVAANHKPIEIYATMPTVKGARFTATITGYRSERLIGESDYDPDGPDSDDPEKQQEWTLVNDAPVDLGGRTYPAGTLALVGATASWGVVNNVPCYQHRWDLEMAPSHNLRLLNAGMYAWVSSSPDGAKMGRIPDPAMGGYRTTPWPLSAIGVALPEGYATAAVVYNFFRITKLIDFSQFNWSFQDTAGISE